MKTRRFYLCLWVSIAIVSTFYFFGCAAKTQIHGVRPAEISMGGIRTIAVLKFDGRYGDIVKSDFYTRLSDSQHFNLIDPSETNKVDKVIFDQLDDPRFLPQLQDLRADGVIAGKVQVSIRDTKGIDQVEMQEGTGQYKEGRNVFGQKIQVEITKPVVRPVKYVIRQASMTTQFKVYELKSKRILATDKITRSYKEKFGGTNENSFSRKLSDLPSKSQTINAFSQQITMKLVAKISPTKFTTSVAFASDKNEMVKKGIKFAQQGAWEEAKELWLEVISMEPTNAAAYYNMGVVYESYGDLLSLQTAKKYYKSAAKYGDKKMYINAVGRVTNRIKDQRKLDDQKRMLNDSPEQKSQGTGGVRIY